MEWLIIITGSLIWIAVSFVIIFLSIIGIMTLTEHWIKDGYFKKL
jgi:hypothetical protein